MTRTLIVFPLHIGQLFGVTSIELGARKAWVQTLAGRVEVPRFAFTAQDLAPDRTQAALAMQASRIAYPR
jgi:hypothetical protein